MNTEKTSRIFLAYDGSINADWVSRYAVRIAANSPGKKLFLFHVLDGAYSSAEIRLKIKAIDDECVFQHVELGHAILPQAKNVYQTIMASIPHGQENFCICGARITSRGKGFLSGTISEKLLRANKFNVLAVRVVHPGLLGCPRDFLVPLIGITARYEPILPFYKLLAPDMRKIHFLCIMRAAPWFLPSRSAEDIRAARKKGFERIRKVLAEMKQHGNSAAIHFDGRVVVSNDWVRETLAHSSRLHTRLIMLEGTDRGLFSRRSQENKIEKILRHTPCDVALFRTI